MLSQVGRASFVARRQHNYCQTILMLACCVGSASRSSAAKDMTSGRVFPLRHGAQLVIKQGDITQEDVDAIVNAANERMLGGGGVDGAIHRAAGPDLVRACAEVPEVRRGVRCPTGEARITPGFRLPARHVIHTVGPIYENARESAPLLAAAYRSSMQLALDKGLRSVSFPGISTGVFGYPFDEAAQVALAAVDEALEAGGEGGSVKEVRFVLFNQPLYDVFVETAEERAARAGGDGAAAKAGPDPNASEL
ncbi:hypothetical protein PLESTB_000695300 [Pleodorina starrii]|uniref:Macro domain-containing protein n=1 Tax=Pleodorina starrii TaxID=330485 RepID=A0A9W6BIU7_9CHLO|nr:hypothetical protein PLESTM_001221700 [Pleodorina starrii]GLC52982.1 hypothetical protein PLESTB_000695300 [Pleodorina starrii]GLC65279.1 hypothetical protein PLESTF_000271700 [Pleodorina starrii]